jgi:radical SAM-linked protein
LIGSAEGGALPEQHNHVEVVISRKPQPEGGQLPVVQKMRIRYAKRGPLRFTSHRDFARAFERAIRRAGVPIAYSQGFTPHPKISYASAAPTGVASEAEYVEIGLSSVVDPAAVRASLDSALSPGLDVLQVVIAPDGGSLADLIDASRWTIELTGVPEDRLEAAIQAFLATDEIMVERMTKQGRRRFDTRAAVVTMTAGGTGPVTTGAVPDAASGPGYARMNIVVRQVTPSVRPDDVLAGLRVVADLEPPVPPRVIRQAQGKLTAQGEIVDPLVDNDAINGEPFIGEPSV